MRGDNYRYDDYRFYGELCLGFGILLLVIGIALPSFTTTWYTTFLGTTVFHSPYLGDGIALAVVGIILIVLSQILHREYRFRISRDLYDKILSPPPPPPPFSKTLSFCPYCGTQNTPDAVFCSKCGKKST